MFKEAIERSLSEGDHDGYNKKRKEAEELLKEARKELQEAKEDESKAAEEHAKAEAERMGLEREWNQTCEQKQPEESTLNSQILQEDEIIRQKEGKIQDIDRQLRDHQEKLSKSWSIWKEQFPPALERARSDFSREKEDAVRRKQKLENDLRSYQEPSQEIEKRKATEKNKKRAWLNAQSKVEEAQQKVEKCEEELSKIWKEIQTTLEKLGVMTLGEARMVKEMGAMLHVGLQHSRGLEDLDDTSLFEWIQTSTKGVVEDMEQASTLEEQAEALRSFLDNFPCKNKNLEPQSEPLEVLLNLPEKLHPGKVNRLLNCGLVTDVQRMEEMEESQKKFVDE